MANLEPPHNDEAGQGAELPLIDISDLLSGQGVSKVAEELDQACRQFGFFRVAGHGVPTELLERMDREARAFFDQPDSVKAEVAMSKAGSAWRGWFPVGGELTSGRPDLKEGLYVGTELSADHPRVASGVPLHGANLFPEYPADLGDIIVEWTERMAQLGHLLMSALGVGLGIGPAWFGENLTNDPTMLFRIFHYPPGSTADWGVGEHTDYGLLTVLAQDNSGGLQVHSQGHWIDVPADPEVLVCNIGDMLERLTEGRYRSTPHRVRNLSGRDRLSFPFFFDPSWDAEVPALPLEGSPPRDQRRRWDGANVAAWQGPYGAYLTAKVTKVFPDLFDQVGGDQAS